MNKIHSAYGVFYLFLLLNACSAYGAENYSTMNKLSHLSQPTRDTSDLSCPARQYSVAELAAANALSSLEEVDHCGRGDINSESPLLDSAKELEAAHILSSLKTVEYRCDQCGINYKSQVIGYQYHRILVHDIFPADCTLTYSEWFEQNMRGRK